MTLGQLLTANLGVYQDAVDTALAEMKKQQIIERIWAHDHTVWKPEPTEITNRLGWLHIADAMLENIPRLESLVEAVRSDGYTHALLLGMGGSSLAPEVFRKTFGVKEGYLNLAVLDSTDPGAVLAYAERLDLSKTLFIVATKSGGTVETLSFFKFFYNQVSETVGADQTGAHFVAITDPSSRLADIAHEHNFRTTFLNDPNIGGRYSALSYFGLVPATLVGVGVEALLQRALAMAHDCAVTENNDGGRLGVIMGELAKAGRDKVTFITSLEITSFGDWAEQLVAESTGKERKGILPVVGEPVGTPDVYGDDRLFVHLRLEGDNTHSAAVQALEDAGHPVVRLRLNDVYDLGQQFFLWEMATAVAGHRLGINPFEQPNVEAAKVLARKMVAEYKEKGTLPAETPVLATGGIAVYRDLKASGSGKKVVVVEDEPEMVDLVKLILGRKGFELVSTVGGRKGLETIRRLKPDLVLVDPMMPDMDGWEIYQQMKADEELKDIPVVVITAKAQSIDKVLGLHIAEPNNLAGILSKLPPPKPIGDTESANSPGEALTIFLSLAQPGNYVALQAYVQPTSETDAALAALRVQLRDRFKLATTVGYGPRFLHSTGQLHKVDAGNGLFIQFTADDVRDAPIPDEAGAPASSISFGVLKMAQALGDRQALLDAGRRVIRFHLGDDVIGGLKQLAEVLA